MNYSPRCIGFALGAALSVAASSIFGQAAPAPAAKAGQPHIQFAEPNLTWDFGKVTPTDTLKHDFVVTNTGDAVLEITAVQPGCGCTTAGAWDRTIEPGKTGRIPIQLNPLSFTGPVSKGATVTCNDPSQPSLYLHISATVWRPVEVQPQYVYFMPVLGEETNETKVVRIVNNLDDDIRLEPPQAPSAIFKTELKTVRPGKEFELHVTYLGPVSNASPQGNITITTSLATMPSININAVAMTQPAVATYPNTLPLPVGPLKADYQAAVTVRNNGHNPITLTNASVNLEGVKAQIQSMDPGRLFNVGLVFPAGFQLKTGQSAELTVKTSHPSHPVLTVPITQPEPAPATAPAPAPTVTTGGAK